MASIHFNGSSLPCLAAILLWSLCAMSYAVPCTTPSSGARTQAIVRREADMTQSQIRSVVEVKLGLTVMQRFIDINLERLPVELFGGQDTKVHERGLLGFSKLYQYLEVFSTLERLGFNNTELTLFRVFVEQILTDACNWIATYSTSQIDCTNPSEFVILLVALGLNPHVDQIDCYLDTTTNTALETMRNQVWVNKTIAGDYEPLRCPFCTQINLKHCCA